MCTAPGPAAYWDDLQILTACLKSFAHGSNDTANAAGPFAAIQSLYLHGLGSCRDISTPLWVLAFCGVGIVVVRAVICINEHEGMQRLR